MSDCQHSFDQWRNVYNCQRPHEALALAVPASRYRGSSRIYSEALPVIEYGPDDLVRQVRHGGEIKFKGGEYYIGSAFHGEAVALRPSLEEDGVWQVYYCQQQISKIDLTEV